MKASIQFVQFRVYGDGGAVGSVNHVFDACHFLLGGGNRLVRSTGNGRDYRRAQSARLGRTADLHRAVANVGVNLHDKRTLFCDSAAVDNLFDLDAVLFQTVDNRQRAKSGRFNQSAIDFRGCRSNRLSNEQAGKLLIDENRSVPVVPVQSQQTGCARRQFGRFRCQIDVSRPFGVFRRREVVYKPVENVANGRLTGFQTVHFRQNRFRDDAAQTGDVCNRRCHGRNHDVTRAGADSLDKRSRLDAASDCAQVAVKRADCNGNSRRQSNLFGDFRNEVARFVRGGNRLGRVLEFKQLGRQRREKFV